MKKSTGDERREFVRAKRVLSIEFRLAKSKRKATDRSWSLSLTHDMSAGGLSFYTDREFHADDVLQMRVVMSGILDVYKGYGKVVRVERKKNGVHFLTAIKFLDQPSPARRPAKSFVSPPKRRAKRV